MLSPGTASRDLNIRKDTYQRFSVPHYWVIDPLEPSLIAFELDEDARYQSVAKVAGDEPFETSQPVPIRCTLTELLGRFAQSC